MGVYIDNVVVISETMEEQLGSTRDCLATQICQYPEARSGVVKKRDLLSWLEDCQFGGGGTDQAW